MNNSIMILGAAGNFASKIATSLAKEGLSLILIGRTESSLNKLQIKIKMINPKASIKLAVLDIKIDLDHYLQLLKPLVVINTCGPFNGNDYNIVKSCITRRIHYIDLADNRRYVTGFCDYLNESAIKNECIAITGASTVPCLSSAVIEHYKDQFKSLDSLKYGISPGQKTDRGLATVKSILSYTGKILQPFAGSKSSYGWQDLYKQTYPSLGSRLMSNCDIPDLDLLPKFYGFKSIRFSGGMESYIVHLSLWFLSWLVRFGLIKNLERFSLILLKLSHLFDWLGTSDGGMHMIISGKDEKETMKVLQWFIIARNGHGPHIPTIPAIILAKKLVQNKLDIKGAKVCIGFITLEEYLSELKQYDVEVYAYT